MCNCMDYAHQTTRARTHKHKHTTAAKHGIRSEAKATRERTSRRNRPFSTSNAPRSRMRISNRNKCMYAFMYIHPYRHIMNTFQAVSRFLSTAPAQTARRMIKPTTTNPEPDFSSAPRPGPYTHTVCMYVCMYVCTYVHTYIPMNG